MRSSEVQLTVEIALGEAPWLRVGVSHPPETAVELTALTFTQDGTVGGGGIGAREGGRGLGLWEAAGGRDIPCTAVQESTGTGVTMNHTRICRYNQSTTSSNQNRREASSLGEQHTIQPQCPLVNAHGTNTRHPLLITKKTQFLNSSSGRYMVFCCTLVIILCTLNYSGHYTGVLLYTVLQWSLYWGSAVY